MQWHNIFTKLLFSKRTLLSLSIIFLHFNIFSQSPQFAEHFSDRLLLNPALAGFFQCPEISLHSQSENISNFKANKTVSFSYDQYVKPMNGGLGIHFLKDNFAQGASSQIYADFIYAYQVKLKNRRKIAFGFQTSFYQKKIVPTNLVLRSMLNPFSNKSANLAVKIAPEQRILFATGFAYFSKNNHFGLSFHNIAPTIRRTKEEKLLKFTTYFAKKIYLKNFDTKKNKYALTPSLLYTKQSYYQLALYGLKVENQKFNLALKLKHNFAFKTFGTIFSIGFSTKSISFVFSYDTMLSKKGALIYSTQQISGYYIIKCHNKNKRGKAIFCPYS